MVNKYETDISKRLNAIRDRYGELLSLENIADIFKYPSTGAVRKANSRGCLPIKLYRFEGKNRLYAKCNEVAEAIEKMKED